MSMRPTTSAADLMARLQSDPDWVAARQLEARERAVRATRHRSEQKPILRDLAAAGIAVDNVWDLVMSRGPYENAFPILLCHLRGSYSARTLEGLARALAVRAARSIAWEPMLRMIEEPTLPEGAKSALFVALSAMAKASDVGVLIALIQDRKLGPKRIFFVRNLMRSKRPQARRTLESLQEDPDLHKEIAARLKRCKS